MTFKSNIIMVLQKNKIENITENSKLVKDLIRVFEDLIDSKIEQIDIDYKINEHISIDRLTDYDEIVQYEIMWKLYELKEELTE